MSTPIPMPLRAVAGLAAVAIDEARRLPDRLVTLPVLAVSAALQASLKVQQQYAELVNRGDQLLSQLRGEPAGTPPWARFDDEDTERRRPASATGDAGPSAADMAAADMAEADIAVAADTTEVADEADPADIADFADVADLAEMTDRAEADLAEMTDDPVDRGADLLAEEVLAETALVEELVAEQALADEALADEALPDETLAEEMIAEEELGDEAAEHVAAVDLSDDVAGWDAAALPLPNYGELSIPQLRARLRTLSAAELERLIGYERATTERAAYLTMLQNRLATVRGT
jgi:hypothetical protein